MTDHEKSPGISIDPALLAILVCPVPECRRPLEIREARLVCTGCGLRYRADDGWPNMIPEEAEKPNAS